MYVVADNDVTLNFAFRWFKTLKEFTTAKIIEISVGFNCFISNQDFWLKMQTGVSEIGPLLLLAIFKNSWRTPLLMV